MHSSKRSLLDTDRRRLAADERATVAAIRLLDHLRAFAEWLGTAVSLHPVAFAAEAHDQLVSVHPFIDGNGRTTRLLMNCLLMAHGFPPAIIRPRDRTAYRGA